MTATAPVGMLRVGSLGKRPVTWNVLATLAESLADSPSLTRESTRRLGVTGT